MSRAAKTLNLVVIAIFVFNIAVTSLVLAQDSSTGGEVLGGLGKTGEQAGYGVKPKTAEPIVEFTEAFPRYATGLAALFGGLFTVLAIYAGWLWLTARGNEEQVTKAKGILRGAIIGIAIIIVARIIAELALVALEGTVVVE